MGISIFGGAITTLGAGLPLFACTMKFFNKFGILIVCTICYSLLFSLVFFAALCHIAGPTGTTGDLKPLMKRCFGRCCRKKEGKQVEP